MKNIIKSLSVILISFGLLAVVQIKMDNPMLLLERFFEYGGWVEITILSLFGGFLYIKMLDPIQTKKWRIRSWTLFSVVFFLQLILGLIGFEEFLMTGKLHLPIPGVIVGGAVYRMEFSFMPILLLSTIVITGPAWCSQLCYFGAFDYLAANTKKKTMRWKYINRFKFIFFSVFILAVICLRIFDVNVQSAAILASSFGVLGILIILVFSIRKGSMVHCVAFCPINTIVSLSKYINPFRMYIDNNCTKCMKCVDSCKYFALNEKTINNKKPGFTCTYCGDCISVCQSNSIKYKLFNIKADKARQIYLATTIIVYIVFLGLARI